MFVYQKKIFMPLSEACPEEVFFGAVRAAQTRWLVDNLRMALDYAERDADTWSKSFSEEFMRYLQEQTAKPKVGKAFVQKTQKEKLLAYAKSLKDKLPAALFQAKGFELTLSEKAREKITDETTEEEIEAMKRPWVKQAAVQLSGLCMLDIDHVDAPRKTWELIENGQLTIDNELRKQILLVYITPSGHGLKIVFKADVERGNLIDNQLWLANVLGVKADEGCKDASRRSYLTTESDILYINKEELFNYENKEFAEKYDAEYRAGHSGPTKTDDVAAEDAEQNAGEDGQMGAQQDVMVDAELQNIIDAWTKERFGDGTKQVSRHEASVALARDLYIMLDRDARQTLTVLKAQKWVQDMITERNEDVERTVRNAAEYVAAAESETAKKGKTWLPKPSKEWQKAMKEVNGEGLTVNGEKKGTINHDSLTMNLNAWGEEIESMFDDFPVLKDVCEGLKRSQYPAAMFVAGGVLMTLMTRCWYRFYHRPQQERRLNCSLYIIGHPASNKSMADDINDVLITPMQAADAAGKAALNRYKKENKKKAANKEGKDKPQGIIRIHPSRTSNGQLIEDMLNAKEIVDGKEMQLHMYTFDTELDNSITLQSGGSWINKQAMELKAFHNEKDGQMYQNQDSPVDEFRVMWNYIYSGTLIALKKKVNERNFGSGLSTRLTVIPMPKTNYEMIKYEEATDIDWQRIERMKSWAYKLDGRYGELPLWPLVKRLYDWTKNRMDDCREDDSEANELMLKRVPYHALNFSAPFIDMRHWGQLHQEGNSWTGQYEVDDTDWKLCELIARIQYAMQQHFFGVLAEKYFDDMNNDVQFSGKRHQSKSIEGYNRLPEVFTKDDVDKIFKYNNTKSAFKKIERLLADNLIERIAEGDEAGKYLKKTKSIA
jgi:hypothetical protein